MCGTDIGVREYEMMLRSTDPISLHLEASLGYAKYVPNLETGCIETIAYIEFAHLIHPSLNCPSCGEAAEDGIVSKFFVPSLVILSTNNQCSYLCESCWTHSIISSFGNHSEAQDAT